MKAIMFAILSGVGGGKEKEEKQEEEEEEEEELDAISRDCYVLVVVECSAAANGLAISCTRSSVLTNSLFRRYIKLSNIQFIITYT